MINHLAYTQVIHSVLRKHIRNKCLILIIDESSSSSLSRTTPIKCWLVVYLYPSEKYDFVSWDYYSQYMESHKIPWFQSPPTSS